MPEGAKRASRKKMTRRTAPPISSSPRLICLTWRARRPAARRGLEIDSGIGGDDLRDLDDGGGNGGIVVPCLQLRNDGAADDADFAVGQNAFEAVAGLDAAFAVLNGEEQDDAAVGSLRADLPFVFEGGGEVFDRLAVERFHRDHGDLGVGLAIDL